MLFLDRKSYIFSNPKHYYLEIVYLSDKMQDANKTIVAGDAIGRISHIAMHPIKGGRMIEVNKALLRPDGLEGDREFMIVKGLPDSNGIHDFITQKRQGAINAGTHQARNRRR